ncbi:MAG: hypothetical protein QNJ30_12730 [Kiloniellales bacterium]|nr:hypothetical protein [Kiloniellales bacterium]
MPQIEDGRAAGPKACATASRPRWATWVLLGLLTACASPHDYKFPIAMPDKDYEVHRVAVQDCRFGDADSDDDLYPGYHVENHILEATEQGGVKYRAPGNARNDFDLAFSRIFNCYLRFRSWAEEKEFKQVLIYFNGGLNPPGTVKAQAKKQVPSMLRDGYYPIFLIWPTGPVDTYLEQVAFVRNGTRQSDPQLLGAPLNFVGDLGQGLARAPVNYLSQLFRVAASTNPFGDADRREFLLDPVICKENGSDGAVASGDQDCDREETDVGKLGIQGGTVSAERNLMTGKEPDRKPGLALRDVPYYGLFATRFLSTPMIDALGKTMWENMVRRTRTTIRRPIEYDINLADNLPSEAGKLPREDREYLVLQVEAEKRRFPNGIGAFAKFFTLLQYCIASEPTAEAGGAPPEYLCPDHLVGDARPVWRDIELTVIGHSMGTIVMNELIPLHPDLPYRNLVFMAAAASVRDSARAMSPLIIGANEKTGETTPLHFYNLMLHPKNDALERVAFGAAPSGSLLAWVDEMYEAPKTAIDRTMGKWRNLRATRHVFLKAAREHMLFRVFDWAGDWEGAQGDAAACEDGRGDGTKHPPPSCYLSPTTHSGFNDDEAHFWCPFFWGADKVRWWGPETPWPAGVCPAG